MAHYTLRLTQAVFWQKTNVSPWPILEISRRSLPTPICGIRNRYIESTKRKWRPAAALCDILVIRESYERHFLSRNLQLHRINSAQVCRLAGHGLECSSTLCLMVQCIGSQFAVTP